jgi:DNA repair exonuclease SbcCD ATPase subunit
MVRFLEIEIENFRGFAVAQTLALDADVVLVSGANGTGKTSLTDALTWNLTGKLPGLAARLKGERKGEDYVRSCYGSGTARVRLSVAVDDERWQIERRGDANGSELQITPSRRTPSESRLELANLFGFERPDLLDTSVHAWGVLRQDSMRATLEEGSEALHRRLREILGLSSLAEFETATRDAASAIGKEADSARNALDQLVEQLNTARAELEAAETSDTQRAARQATLDAGLERLSRPSNQGVTILMPSSVDSTSLSKRLGQLDDLIGAALDLEQQIARAPARVDAPSDEELKLLRTGRDEAAKAYHELEARQDARLRLAEDALRLLSDHCPVCAQEIDQESVREKLEEQIADRPEAVAAMELARARLTTAIGAVEDAEGRLRQAETADSVRQQTEERWSRALLSAEEVTAPEAWRSLDGLPSTLQHLQGLRDDLRALRKVLLDLESDPAIADRRARVQELEAAESQARASAAEAAARHADADGLRRAALESSVEITERSLKALEPAFAEVYDRLAPHPSFTTLRMSHDVFYGKGRSMPRIFDPIRDIEANPNLVCSEGQLDIIALSYFLALNLETDPGALPFAVLDDPLQAMDVINALGFCDVARALRRRRQLIITTHDRRFATLMERKLGPRAREQRTLLLEFSSWDRSGPRVKTTEPALEEIPTLLREAA